MTTHLSAMSRHVTCQEIHHRAPSRALTITNFVSYEPHLSYATKTRHSAAHEVTHMGLNRDCIGRSYAVGPFEVTAAGAKAYALATNDENPLYLNGELAPPVFGVVWELPAMLAALSDPELRVNLLRLVHGEHRMHYVRPVTPGMLIRTAIQVTNIEDKGSGELMSVALTSTNQHGELVLFSRSGFFIRGSGGAKPAAGAASSATPAKPAKAVAPATATAPAETPTYAFSVAYPTTEDQPVRYAEASGDYNPIHLDEETAKRAGLPRTILHGLCSMAFAQRAVINEKCGGDPKKLKALGVRFTKPVLPGETLTIRATQTREADMRTAFALEALNPAGEVVVADATAEIG